MNFLSPLFSSAVVTGMIFSQTVSAASPVTERAWYVINDGVMGGLSHSQVDIHEDTLIFTGHVSLENNGGFASIRTIMTAIPGSSQIQLTLLGDGKAYQLRLRTTESFDGPAFVHEFTPPKGEWQTFTVEASDFHLQYRGRKLQSDRQLKLTDVKQIGFLIAGKQQGDFTLHIKSLRFLSSI
ncbi:CIA30 family protein [Thalassotalea sp. HSM 43]|uniref:CIA30 family protein n=1 Tax=Thalassotalea sp. HSM 43 TaxID=2552945 RepID=UPI0010820AE3|nr:CIA30 family protein [Thalassotalea sp. HSM 43]QBY05644.1 CIA30 family protein [Thalassotalea sp. HSM 43]